MKTALLLVVLAAFTGGALAKLPAPALSDEAKAKAAETAARTAHAGKVADYQLCESQDRVAARYHADAKKAGNDMAPVATPPCVNPGPFVYTPPAPVAQK
jgi:hypothetical protein